MLNVGRLRVLREVAYRGSISAAAEALSYTQSAVSQQIATLEAETGMPLLERHPRGVSLTAAGQTLVATPRGSSPASTRPRTPSRRSQGLRGGRLRMASFATAGATLMPLAIAAFRAAYPDVELTLAEGEPEQIVPRLRAGELDLALLFEFAGESTLARADDGVDAVRGPDVPRAARRAPARRSASAAPGGPARGDLGADLAREPCARHVVRCCHAAGFEPQVAFESDDYQTVQGLVAAGVGVALIPGLALSACARRSRSARLARAARARGDRRGARRRAPGAGRAGDARDPRAGCRGLRQGARPNGFARALARGARPVEPGAPWRSLTLRSEGRQRNVSRHFHGHPGGHHL